MKKITFLLAFLIASVGLAQTSLEDFEGTPNVGGFSGLGEATVVDNPVSDSNNNSDKVLKIVTSTSGDGWQGANIFMVSNYIDATTPASQPLTAQVYSTVAFTMLGKVDGGQSGAVPSAADASHTGSGWETLTFTFNENLDGTASSNGEYGTLAVFPNWNGSGWNTPPIDVTIYIDNISGTAGGAIGGGPADPEPTDAPPTPPSFDAANVMSLYGDSFAPAASIANVTWDDSEFEEVNVAGNNVLKITGSNFIGMDLDTYLDASSMTHLHMDYWIATDWAAGMVMNPKLSDHANQSGETSAIEITNPIGGQSEVKNWQSKDFPLDGGARASIKQFLITQAGFAGVFYLDNVYMYVDGTAGVDNNDLLGFSMFPNPSKDRLNISAKNNIEKAEIYNVLGKKVMTFTINKNSESLDVSNLTSGIYLIKYTVNDKVGTSKFVKQ